VGYNTSKLLKEAERLYQRGDKRKGAELVESVLMKDFNDSSAWALLHRQYGNGKPLSAFQREFTQTYYPDKLVLLKDKEESTNGNREKRGLFGRLLGASSSEPVSAQATSNLSPDAEADALSRVSPALFEDDDSGTSASAVQLDLRTRSQNSSVSLPTKPSQPANPAEVPAPSTSSNTIRVMVVDDIAMTRENIIRSLTFEKQIEVVGSAENGRQAIAIVGSLQPDVIIMDINMPGMDGIAATREVTQIVPYTQVVILTVQDDPDYLRKAMMAGARDFLSKPPTIDELIGAVLRAGEIAHRGRAKMPARTPIGKPSGNGLMPAASGKPGGKIITVYSPKGGAGCTLVASNLAACLHTTDTRVALVDGSLQFGDLLVLFNEQSKNSVLDLASRAHELDAEIVDDVMVTHKSGIRILAATAPEMAEQVTGEQFSALLEHLRSMFAYIIVDTTSRLSDVTIAALDSSDAIVLLTTQDIHAIANVRKFLDLVPLLKLDRRRILTVMNQYNSRIKIDPIKVGQTLQNEIVATLPEDARIVIPSINRGAPFMLQSDARSGEIGKSMLKLTESVQQLCLESSLVPASV
jgi:pilus assembly protein CpaE